jgi:hypothetical protein
VEIIITAADFPNEPTNKQDWEICKMDATTTLRASEMGEEAEQKTISELLDELMEVDNIAYLKGYFGESDVAEYGAKSEALKAQLLERISSDKKDYHNERNNYN